MNTRADTLPKLLLRNAALQPGLDAMREKYLGIWQTWTWADYAQEVKRLALGLAELGFKRGDRLAVVGDNRPHLYAAILAAQALGGIALAVYQDAIADEMGFVLSHAEVKIIVAEDEEQVDKLFDVRERIRTVEKVIYLDPRGLRRKQDPWLAHIDEVLERGDRFDTVQPGYYVQALAQAGAGDVALLCYTSGTTGQPKGVMLTHENLIAVTQQACDLEGWSAKDEVMAYLPIAWVGDTVISVAGALLAGMTVNCPEDPSTIQRDYREIGPTIIFAPPRNWENVLTRIQVRMEEAGWLKRRVYERFMGVAARAERTVKDGKQPGAWLRLLNGIGNWLVRAPLRDLLGLRRIRAAYTGGAPLGPDVFDFFRALGINLKQLYGLTESAAACVYQPDGEARPDTVGRPVPGVEVRVDESGEILLRGPMNFKGYFKNDEATKNAYTPDGWLHTGDAGFLDATGHLKVIDRAKDVSRLNDGTLFAPQFLENKLKFSPYIKEAVTLGVGRDHVAAMINIDMDSLANWAERHGVTYSGYRELSQHDATHKLIQSEIRKINRGLAQDRELAGAQVKRFLILYKELDPDDGEITRTRKIRRGVISERYSKLIEALFSGTGSVDVEIPVTYEDGRTAQLNATVKVWDVGPLPGQPAQFDKSA
jgi:long-chain acyl-CoA synthetase